MHLITETPKCPPNFNLSIAFKKFRLEIPEGLGAHNLFIAIILTAPYLIPSNYVPLHEYIQNNPT